MNRIGLKLSGISAAVILMAAVACGTSGDTNMVDSTGPEGDAPAMSGALPRASLSYEGAIYYPALLASEELVRLNEEGLEFVGSTEVSNTLAPGSGESLNIYRPQNGRTGEVYTKIAGRSFENEDGETITFDAEWARWTTDDGAQSGGPETSQGSITLIEAVDPS